jgi:uncharacterized protein YkwD
VAGLFRNRIEKTALLVLVFGLFALIPVPAMTHPSAARRPAGYTGLRPDWVRLPPAPPTPSPIPIQITPTPPPEPSPTAEIVAPPTVEAEPPPEPIAIAAVPPSAVPPSAEAPPSDTPEVAPPTVAETPPEPAVTEGLDLALAEDIVALTNQTRLANGLTALVEHPALVAAAEAYADLHAHVSPDRLDHTLNGSTVGTRADAAGYVGWMFLGENLIWSTFDGCRSAEDLVQEWLNSPAHRGNMLNPALNEIGVGCYVSAGEQPFCICAQEFGVRPPQG